jgi:hypothetical protein
MSCPPSPMATTPGERFPQALVPSRPHTTGNSGRVRTPSSGRTNRKNIPIGVLKTTGQYALNQTQSARPCVSSFNPKSQQSLETVSLLRLKIPESKDWMSEAKSASFMSPQFDETVLELAEEKQKNVQRAYDNYNADKARRKLQRLVNQKFAGSVDILFKNADLDKNGVLDFGEFSAILKRNSLEQFFGRKDQRDIFKAIGDNENEVSFIFLLIFLINSFLLYHFIFAEMFICLAIVQISDLSTCLPFFIIIILMLQVSMDQFVSFLQQNPSNSSNPKVVKQPLISPTDVLEKKPAHLLGKNTVYIANMNKTQGSDMKFSTSPQERTVREREREL